MPDVRRLLARFSLSSDTVRQQLTNPAATAFWRKAIRYPFQEHEQGTGIVQSVTGRTWTDESRPGPFDTKVLNLLLFQQRKPSGMQ
jgi:hypothetical protein